MTEINRTSVGAAAEAQGVLRFQLLCGVVMGVIFILGTLVLAPLIPGYSLVRHSVSEIGQMGGPLRWPFAAFLILEAALVFVFGRGLSRFSRAQGVSRWPARLVYVMTACYVGLAVFPTPHPLHNLFGLIQTAGYGAMLAAALSWRRRPSLARLAGWSGALFALFLVPFLAFLVCAIVAASEPGLLKILLATQGLSQRTYIYTFHLWCIWVGLSLAGVAKVPSRL